MLFIHMLMPQSEVAAVTASYIELVIGVFGLFGNVNILVAVYTRKHLRSKCALLMALIAFYDSISIFFEFFQAFGFLFSIEFSRRECFNYIFMYSFVLHLQIFTVLSLAVDRFVSIVFPRRYRIISAKRWIIATCIPGLIVNVVFLPWANFTMDDGITDGCNPPESLPFTVAIWWSRMTVAVNVLVVVTYISFVIAIKINVRRFAKYAQERKENFLAQQRAAQTVSIIILVFAGTWFFTQTIAFVYYGSSTLSEQFWFQALSETAAVPVMFGYSLNYYVYFWRSSEYRRVFKDQLRLLIPCAKRKFLFSKSQSHTSVKRNVVCPNGTSCN
ncbi:hypothetical protein QR680_014902 [Steinernema hermaphroditum]|uniref:G-protein coupled receptors family 1 profile domain-containing protein n=1 Tax=Steinernema hermaphroditum TaxID=289476 RepID=A0AA39ICM9_9BILA|nr:hypothetical protein QR680_014902 [Steinernema hermaphroditum]